MTPDVLRRLSVLADTLDGLIAAAIALGRNEATGDRPTVERLRLNVLALAVPEAAWLIR
jgi:hypothetical protein